MKNVALFSTGVPDPTQGGSGIFNYYIIKELQKKYFLDCYFRANKKFIKNHSDLKYLKEFKNIKIYFIYEKEEKSFFLFGFNLLAKIHFFEQCNKFIANLKKKYDNYISLDLGWAYSLRYKENVLSILGDPCHLVRYYRIKKNFFSLFYYYSLIRSYSLGSYSTISKLGDQINKKNIIASFTKNHATEYSQKGLICKTLDWFSPYVSKNKVINLDYKLNGVLNFLHIGDLSTTASFKMIDYLQNELFEVLKNKNFNFNIKFIGRYKKIIEHNHKNINLIFTDHVKDIRREILGSHVFLSLSKYPVGTRTRVLTAMSYGLPCIVDETASLGLYQLKNNYDILYTKSSKNFSILIDSIIKNPALLRDISLNGRKSWEKYFNPKKNVKKIINILSL